MRLNGFGAISLIWLANESILQPSAKTQFDPRQMTDRAAIRSLAATGPLPEFRAAICAAGKRGSFRQIWVPPIDELALLSRNELGVFLAPRVSLVRERMAQLTWATFMRAHAGRPAGQDGDAPSFLAKIALGETVGERAHLWVAVRRAEADGGEGVLDRPDGSREAVAFRLEQVGDWRIVGLRPDLPEVGPEGASVLD